MNRSRNYTRYTYTADELAEMARDDARQRMRDDALEAQIESMIAAVHPAFEATARRLIETDGDCSEEACIAFVLEQVTKLGLRCVSDAAPELRAIYRDIQTRGGDAYAAHKARLQQLAKAK